MTGMSATNIQVTSLIAMIIILVLSLFLWRWRPQRRLQIIPPAAWAGLAAGYYIGVLTGFIPSGDLALFLSSVLRLMESILVLGGLIIFIWRPKEKRPS